jgi:FG-GAP repeat
MAGAAWVVPGGTGGSMSLSAYPQLTGENAGDFGGYAVASAGDSDGDGVGDVLIGAYGASAAAGKSWLVYGPFSGNVDMGVADITYIGETAGDSAGWSVAGAGDVDGDGLDDAVIGATGHDYGAAESGAAYVMLGGAHGGATSLTSPDAKVVGENGGDAAGWSVAIAPDMDGDGSDDLLVGAQLNDAGGSDAGAAYLLYGPITTTYDLGTADAKLQGEASSDYAGASVAGVGDTDGDGKGDILVGAPFEDYGGWSIAGSAYLVRGTGL